MISKLDTLNGRAVDFHSTEEVMRHMCQTGTADEFAERFLEFLPVYKRFHTDLNLPTAALSKFVSRMTLSKLVRSQEPASISAAVVLANDWHDILHSVLSDIPAKSSERAFIKH